MKNEKHTRKEIIDIWIKQVGWNIKDRIDTFKKNFSGSIYLADTVLMDKWLSQDNWENQLSN